MISKDYGKEIILSKVNLWDSLVLLKYFNPHKSSKTLEIVSQNLKRCINNFDISSKKYILDKININIYENELDC